MSKIYNEPVQRVDGIKKIIIHVTDGMHAELLIKLRYHGFKQKSFFKLILESYINDDEDLKAFLDKKLDEKNSKHRRNVHLREEQEEKELVEDFGLDEEEIKNIFDIIEKENPEL